MNNNDPQSDFEWLRLAAYLCDSASPEDHAGIEQWLDADPARRHQLDQLRAAWTAIQPDPVPALDAKRMWSEIVAATGIQAMPRVRVTDFAPPTRVSLDNRVAQRAGLLGTSPLRRLTQTSWRRATLKIAAAVAVMVVAILVLGRGFTTHDARSHRRQYVTGPGQQATITLRDGTRVVLAPRSQLLVQTTFDGASRDVSLRGEAYFDVAHSAGAPFTVQAGAVRTRVLGTAFDIAAYRDTKIVRVAVVSGRVLSQGRSSAITIPAGRVAQITDSSATMLAGTTAAQYTTWTNGRFVFSNTPVAEVLSTLSHWYDIDFRMTDSSLWQQHVTGTFDTRSQANALTVLKGVLDASLAFERKDGRLIVTIRSWENTIGPRGTTKSIRDVFPHSLTEVGR